MKQFKDKTVLISGGGNSAIDWANLLEPIAQKVYLVYRRDSITGHESQVTQLMSSSIECIFTSFITRLIACKNQLSIESVEIQNHENGELINIAVDDVLINH